MSAFAGTCTDNTVPTGRVYVDKISKLQVNNDYAVFKYIKEGTESGWLTFELKYLCLLLTAGVSSKKLSFFVVQNQCLNSMLFVDKFQIEF